MFSESLSLDHEFSKNFSVSPEQGQCGQLLAVKVRKGYGLKIKRDRKRYGQGYGQTLTFFAMLFFILVFFNVLNQVDKFLYPVPWIRCILRTLMALLLL